MVSRLVSRASLAAIALTAVVVISGCSAPDSGDADGDGASADMIRYQLYQAPTSFNPFVSLNGADGEIAALQYRSLVRLENQEIVPGVAESWESNEDGSVFTFTIDEFNWSDGEPVTVDDVIFSYETYADPATASTFAGQLNLVQGVEEFVGGTADSISGLQAIDDTTLQIELAQPNVAFLADLLVLAIVPEHVFSDIEPAALTGNEAFRSPTVGSGPYIFSEWVTDDQIKFVPNPESPEDHPLDSVYAQYLAADAARAQLETGEIDIAQIAAAEVDAVEGLGTITVQFAPGEGVISLYTALGTGKLADPLVRQAILHAIDRESIVQNVLAGSATVVDTLLFAPDWAVPDGLTEYDYDPEKAKELLAEAGWDFTTEINLQIVPGQADRDAVMDIVAGQLNDIGLKATIQQVQPAEITSLVENHSFDIIITTQGINTSEPGSINARWLCDGGLNISHYCNPDLDELLTAAVQTSDQSERAALYADAQKIINHDVPAMPLYVPNTAWGSTARVQGFDPAVGLLPSADDWTVAD